MPEGWREQVLDLVNHRDHRAEVERERARLTEKQRRLRRAWLEVEIDDETYRREQTGTQAQLDALVMPDEPDIVAAGQFLETLQTIWDEATASERKQLLNTLLEAVFVDVVGKRLVCVQPKADFVRLCNDPQKTGHL